VSVITVVSCVYGDYERFVPAWDDAVRHLGPAPDCVLKWRDPYNARLAWRHPQAFMLQAAISEVETDWVVIADIDDQLHPDALAGLEDVTADVWQLGFDRSDGERYIPPTLTAEQVLAMDRNVLVGSSAIRTESFHAVGGFPDIALQDWGLWRRMARAGMTFQSSGRTHFTYNRHDATRGAQELTSDARAAHLAEMMESELAAV
jgi:hypothetical protein